MNSWIFCVDRWRKDVRKSMMKKELSYRDLAQNCAMSLATLHRAISGKRDIYMDEFIMISAILDLCAIEYFDEKSVQKRMF